MHLIGLDVTCFKDAPHILLDMLEHILEVSGCCCAYRIA